MADIEAVLVRVEATLFRAACSLEQQPDADTHQANECRSAAASVAALRAALARPAGDAGAMRERAAKVCDEAAAESQADERKADRSGEDELSALACEARRTATYLAETIRALPIPPATAVEVARRAFYEACEARWRYRFEDHDDTGWEDEEHHESVCDARWTSFIAAEAAAKGGADAR